MRTKAIGIRSAGMMVVMRFGPPGFATATNLAVLDRLCWAQGARLNGGVPIAVLNARSVVCARFSNNT